DLRLDDLAGLFDGAVAVRDVALHSREARAIIAHVIQPRLDLTSWRRRRRRRRGGDGASGRRACIPAGPTDEEQPREDSGDDRQRDDRSGAAGDHVSPPRYSRNRSTASTIACTIVV